MLMRLALAVKATLPLIACTTRDTVNFAEILAHLTKRKPKVWSPQGGIKIDSGSVYFWICPKGFANRLPLEGIYEQATNAESSVIIVNPNQMEPIFFDCGEVDIPKDMLLATLKTIIEDEPKAMALARSLGGCTLKESVELARLTMAGTSALTPDGVMSTRKDFFQPSRGFTQLETRQVYYEPSSELTEWIEDEGGYFLTGNDTRLRARGLLLDGIPGTGKTSGAKWIAHKLGVPLFRLDFAATKNKYVGESENNLLSALARLDNEEPAVCLMDEIEKIFASSSMISDAGTTPAMLSQMLWWLQEHKSRVLTVMTTNKLAALPKELVRPGRIDKTLTTAGLEQSEATTFVKRLLATFPELKEPLNAIEINGIVKRAFVSATIPDTSPKQVPHADLAVQVHRFVKHKVTVSAGLADLFKTTKG